MQRDTTGERLQAGMIWLPSAPAGSEAYVAFRGTFRLDAPTSRARLHLFADSRYVLWVNGEYVQRGPCRFDPGWPEYDTLDLAPFLRAGDNVLCVLVHHYAGGANGRIMEHAPGLTAILEWTDATGACQFVTGPHWRGSARTRFLPSGPAWGSIPDNVDARHDDGDWTLPEYDDGAWEAAAPVEGSQWGALCPRAIPLMRQERVSPAAFRREDGAALALPVCLKAPATLVVDMGRTVHAHPVLEFDAAEGTQLEVAGALGLVNGTLDKMYEAGRYTARAGRQCYEGGDALGFRSLLLRVTEGSLTLHAVQALERLYPYERVGRFASGDAFLDELWRRGVFTVELCSDDGYVDCTPRERAEWMGDAALVEWPVTRAALAGPGEDGQRVWADPRLMRNLMRHIAQSRQPDGRLKAHHPSDRWDIHAVIEDYSCLWVMALRQFYEATGDAPLVRELWPTLTAQMRWFLERRTESGLVHAREFIFFDNPLRYRECEGATTNACLYGALRDAAVLAATFGEAGQAEEYAGAAEALGQAYHRHLWDEAAGTYRAARGEGEENAPTAHAVMLALYNGVVPRDCRHRALAWLLAHRADIGMPYTHYFLFDILYREDSDALDRRCLSLMRERWASTLARTDRDTVFEAFGGGSLCHNMGAVPSYFLSAYVLGARLEDQRILFAPHPGDLPAAEGVAVTELGAVPVRWQREEGGFSFAVEIPAGAQATLALPAEDEGARLLLDGRECPEARRIGRRLVAAVGPGKHTGRVVC